MKFVRALAFCLGFVGVLFSATQSASVATTTMTWGEDKEFNTLDPRTSHSRHDAQAIMQMFDALVFKDADGKLYPWLAERWEYSKDGKSITFALRRDVKFHDNTPFNADAVKFTLDSVQDPKVGSVASIDFIGPYKSSEVLNAYTVRVNWKEPFAPGLTALSNPWWFGIVSPTAVRKLGNAGFARHPVGTGPFRFVEWVPRVRVVLERNEVYRWAPRAFDQQGPSKIGRLVLRFAPDDSTRVAALEKGDIDVADALPAVDVKRLRDSGNFAVMTGDVSGTPLMYMLNTSKPPLDDVRVRRAFIYAVDRPRLVQEVFFGVSKPAYGPLTATTPGYWPGVEKMYPYDPGKARQLLEEAGWKTGADGTRFKDGKPLELVFFASPADLGFSEAVQSSVKEVGIKLNVEKLTFAKFDEAMLNNKHHVADLRWQLVDPSVLGILFYSQNIPAPGKFKFNWSHFASPELDRMLREADSTVDTSRRNEAVAAAQKFVMENALIFPAFTTFQPIGYRRSIQGLRFAQGYWQVLFYGAGVR